MISYTLRIPDDLYARIKQAAEQDRRSIQGQMLWLIDRSLAHREEGE